MPKLKNTLTCFGAAFAENASKIGNSKRYALRNIAVVFISIKLSKIPTVRALLEIHYLPSIAYFSKFTAFQKIIIDDTENFGRQSYRNRCYIAGANGKMPLIVPVKHSRSTQKITDVEIDNATNWQQIHWKSIYSAYGNSPFFEYYESLILPFYTKKYQHLFGFNLDIIKALLKILKLKDTELLLLSEVNENDIINLKESIHPKKDNSGSDKHFSSHAYMQVFEEKHGFLLNLSILDLLFCEGPNAQEILKTSFISE